MLTQAFLLAMVVLFYPQEITDQQKELSMTTKTNKDLHACSILAIVQTCLDDHEGCDIFDKSLSSNTDTPNSHLFVMSDAQSLFEGVGDSDFPEVNSLTTKVFFNEDTTMVTEVHFTATLYKNDDQFNPDLIESVQICRTYPVNEHYGVDLEERAINRHASSVMQERLSSFIQMVNRIKSHNLY